MKAQNRKKIHKTVVAISYLVHCDTLLQNAIDIMTKCDSFFAEKIQQ